jgi:hypothetical protein
MNVPQRKKIHKDRKKEKCEEGEVEREEEGRRQINSDVIAKK